jgi:trans-aconitate methyltransferase
VVDSGFAAIFVNYTLSPEAHNPTAINEAYAATKWVAEHGDEISRHWSALAPQIILDSAAQTHHPPEWSQHFPCTDQGPRAVKARSKLKSSY